MGYLGDYPTQEKFTLKLQLQGFPAGSFFLVSSYPYFELILVTLYFFLKNFRWLFSFSLNS